MALKRLESFSGKSVLTQMVDDNAVKLNTKYERIWIVSLLFAWFLIPPKRLQKKTIL